MAQHTPLNQILKEWKQLWIIYNIIIAFVTVASSTLFGLYFVFISGDTVYLPTVLKFLLINFAIANICFCAGPVLDFYLGCLGLRFREAIFIVGTFVASGLAFFSVLGPFNPFDPFDHRPFNRSVWLAQANMYSSDNPRAGMVGNIKRHYIKPGISQQRVIELLGEPDSGKQKNEYEYILGFGINNASFSVHFDSNGLVTETNVIIKGS